MKMIWSCGPIAFSAEDKGNVFEFYKSLVTSKHQALESLNTLLQSYHPNQIIRMILTFLSRVLNPDTSTSAAYLSILNSFYHSKSKNIERALYELSTNQLLIIDDELRLRIFVLSLID